MPRILILITCLLGLASCGKGEDTSPPKPPPDLSETISREALIDGWASEVGAATSALMNCLNSVEGVADEATRETARKACHEAFEQQMKATKDKYVLLLKK